MVSIDFSGGFWQTNPAYTVVYPLPIAYIHIAANSGLDLHRLIIVIINKPLIYYRF